MAFNRKKSEVNGAEQEKIAALKALNRKNNGVNSVEPKNSGATGIDPEKKRHKRR